MVRRDQRRLHQAPAIRGNGANSEAPASPSPSTGNRPSVISCQNLSCRATSFVPPLSTDQSYGAQLLAALDARASMTSHSKNLGRGGGARAPRQRRYLMPESSLLAGALPARPPARRARRGGPAASLLLRRCPASNARDMRGTQDRGAGPRDVESRAGGGNTRPHDRLRGVERLRWQGSDPVCSYGNGMWRGAGGRGVSDLLSEEGGSLA